MLLLHMTSVQRDTDAVVTYDKCPPKLLVTTRVGLGDVGEALTFSLATGHSCIDSLLPTSITTPVHVC